MTGVTKLSIEMLAEVFKRDPEVVAALQEASTAREMESNGWDELDDPVEALLWLLLLHDPKVTVDVKNRSVSGVNPENQTYIDQFKVDAEAKGVNTSLIPNVQYNTT